MLSGCASVEIPQAELKGQAARAANIPVDEIRFADPVRFGQSKTRESYIPFVLGIYVQSSSHVYLFSYDTTTRSISLKTSIPIRQLRSTFVATRGAFNHLQQLQLEGPDGFIAVNFNNSSDAEAGSKERTSAAIAKLEADGLKVFPTGFWFLPQNIKGFSFPIPAPK
jgi:hypothetical protein